MNGKPTLYVDQFGNYYHAKSAKELRDKLGGGRILPMYEDVKGKPFKVGYVIGTHWCTAFSPVKIPTLTPSKKKR